MPPSNPIENDQCIGIRTEGFSLVIAEWGDKKNTELIEGLSGMN